MIALMLDIESMSLETDTLILSVSIVKFNIATGKQLDYIDLIPNREEQISKGRSVSVSTTEFWLKQSSKASAIFTRPQTSCKQVAFKIYEFCFKADAETIWSNGADFDIPVVTHFCKMFGVNEPWPFWIRRDVPTLRHLADGLVSKDSFPFEGTAHNSLDDAKHQVVYTSAMYRALHKIKMNVINKQK